MITDPDQLSLKVRADESVISAEVSVKLGLIVTELVINALKHAFPNHRRGLIVVEYQAAGSSWTLSVTDDGVGMPVDLQSAKPGLGTTIVEALAKQLNAQIEVTAYSLGTSIRVVHGDPSLSAVAA